MRWLSCPDSSDDTELIQNSEKEKNVKLVSRSALALSAIAALTCSMASIGQAKEYITNPATQSRAYSLAVVSEKPKKTIYFAGQTGRIGADGKPIESFDGQARRAFELINETLKKSGGDLSDVVSMTVFISDVRNGEHFPAIRQQYFPNGKYPGSALIAVAGLIQQAQIEIQGVAVIDDK
jgi:2-iminobutanoate/2-iminopropanoate deaminase